MPRFAANLSMMYTEHDFLDRFGAAAADGFEAVEFLFPYAFEPQALASRLAEHGLRQVLFNAPPGQFEAGERGLASLPERRDEFRQGFLSQALPYAQALQCTQIHVMAGLLPAGIDPACAASTAVHWACYEDNLAWAAAQAAPVGVNVLMEPINTRDIPGYLLNRQDQAHAIVQRIGAANLKVQMDLYHCQIVEGDLTMKLRHHLGPAGGGRVAHLQIAGVPDRHEPDQGELNYPSLFAELDALGYRGFVGCEYRPRAGTRAGLGWLQRERQRTAG